MTKGKVVIFCAPSGSGKTTIVKHLLKVNDSFMFSISACTRKMRAGEEHGKDYYFLSIEEFQKKIVANEFLEYEEVYGGNFYGTLKSEVERIWALGKVVLWLEA
jgi:guanylate kinase